MHCERDTLHLQCLTRHDGRYQLVADAPLAVAGGNCVAHSERFPNTHLIRTLGSVFRARALAENASGLLAGASLRDIFLLELFFFFAVACLFGSADHSAASVADHVHYDGVYERALATHVPISSTT